MSSLGADRTALRIEGLKLAFQRKNQEPVSIFEGLSLEVARGEFCCVVGPSGCGKTSLLRLVAGLLMPTESRVIVDGEPINGPSRRVGVVFQDSRLLPWRSAARNVALGIEDRLPRREVAARVNELLRLVGLEGFSAAYPHELSGGMCQRVNLARALAIDPAVLLMDEPFASLDAQTREEQQAALLDIWQRTGKTVLFVTHQLDEALYLGDRVVVLGRWPSGIRLVVNVPFPRPRALHVKHDPHFIALLERIEAAL